MTAPCKGFGFTTVLACVCASLSAGVEAAVSRVAVESREVVLGGTRFGHAGSYEKLTGRVYFTFDPNNPMNTRIVDLNKAPRNVEGMVEAWANFMLLRATERNKRRDVALLEVSNRGNKASLAYFNNARFSLEPTRPEDFGDGFLLRQGLTLIWVGWQFDVPPRPSLLRLYAPVAKKDGKPIQGLVRSDWTLDRSTKTLPLGHRGHLAYPVADPADTMNVMTVRDGREGPRRVVPRDRWRFARIAGGEVIPDRTHIYMPTGFQAGQIYELVYRAEDPVVVGLGLAAVTITSSFSSYTSTIIGVNL